MGDKIHTSATHPIYVDWLPGMNPGAVGLTIAPGKQGGSIMGDYAFCIEPQSAPPDAFNSGPTEVASPGAPLVHQMTLEWFEG